MNDYIETVKARLELIADYRDCLDRNRRDHSTLAEYKSALMTLPLSELREIQEENRLIKIIDATLGVPEFTDDYTPDDYRSAAMQIVTEHGHNPGSEVYDGINNIISFAFDYHR